MSLHLRSPSVGPHRIFHPTDFSQASEVAFAHALKLTLLFQGNLTIWHLDAPNTQYLHWSQYPRVRQTLQRWGLLGSAPMPEDVAKLGITIEKIQAMGRGVVHEILEEINQHPADLMVLASHQYSGLGQILHRPVAKSVARRCHVPTLFIPTGTRGFVDWETGEIRMKRILIPIDRTPAPQSSIDYVASVSKFLGCDESITATIVHVGEEHRLPQVNLPTDSSVTWEKLVIQGDVTQRICELAVDRSIDVIVLTTAGQHGFLDTLRGSTSEQILNSLRLPMFSIPAAG